MVYRIAYNFHLMHIERHRVCDCQMKEIGACGYGAHGGGMITRIMSETIAVASSTRILRAVA